MTDERLTSLPAVRALPASRAIAVKRALLSEMHEGKRRRPSPRLLLASVAVLGLTATGAATYVATASPDDESLVRCYSVESLDFGDSFPGTSVAVSNDNLEPVPQCALAWRDGILRNGFDEPQQPVPGRFSKSVPDLTACVLPTGVVGVFPGPDGVCQRLSLPVYVAAR